MLKRKVAILPLCFACLMLIAHIAVPHHHHNGTIICLLNFSNEIVAEPHCYPVHHHDDGVAHDCTHHEGYCADENKGCSHSGDENSSEENCFLDDLYLTSETKCFLDIEQVLDSQDNALDFINGIIPKIDKQLLLLGLPYRQNPLLCSYKSLLLSRDSGLRGPPIC